MSVVRQLIAFCFVAALPIGLAHAAATAPGASAAPSASAARTQAAAAANNGHEAPQAQGSDEANQFSTLNG